METFSDYFCTFLVSVYGPHNSSIFPLHSAIHASPNSTLLFGGHSSERIHIIRPTLNPACGSSDCLGWNRKFTSRLGCSRWGQPSYESKSGWNGISPDRKQPFPTGFGEYSGYFVFFPWSWNKATASSKLSLESRQPRPLLKPVE